MRLLYATSITLPSYRANRIQTVNTARAFGDILGKDFTLGVGSATDDSLRGINHVVMVEGIRSFILAFKYISYVKKHTFTHVYCREEKLLMFMLIFNRLFFRVPVTFCYEVHHLVYMRKWWHRLMLRCVHRIISITSLMKESIVEGGYPASQILVSPDAVEVSKFNLGIGKNEARTVLNLRLDKKIIVYTGAINEPWKGVDVLYESSEYFDDSYLFLIVGGKPHYVVLFNENHPQRSNFILVGHKPHLDIPYYLRAADVVVLPNSQKSEISRVSTSPMKMFEYMASKTPIVASDLPSIREILSEDNAVLVNPDDPSDLARGIKSVLENQENGRYLSTKAFDAVQSFTWDKRAKAIIEFIT